MTDIDEEIRKKFAAYGSKGGIKTREKYGREHFSKIGKKAPAYKRRGRTPK